MKRIWGHIASLFVVGTAVSTVVPACASNDQSIFIRSALAPALSRQNGICQYTNDETQPALFQARLDVGVADTYMAVLLVGNQIISRGDPQIGPRAESNRVHINGVVVRVTETDGSLIREFTSLATGFVDPGQGGNNAEYAVIGAMGVDQQTRDMLVPQLPTRRISKLIMLNFKAFGTTLGGVEVESGEFQLPMQVCNGCLVDFSTGNDDTATAQPNCLKAGDATGASSQDPCYVGQDERVKCQLCVATRAACDPKTP